MTTDKKFVELLWHKKYGEFDLGEKMPIERPTLPYRSLRRLIGHEGLRRGLEISKNH